MDFGSLEEPSGGVPAGSGLSPAEKTSEGHGAEVKVGGGFVSGELQEGTFRESEVTEEVVGDLCGDGMRPQGLGDGR